MKKLLIYLLPLIIGFASCKQTEKPDTEPPVDLSSLTPEVTPKGTPTGSSYTQQVGATGGRVQSPDGQISIDIPAGALSANTAIGIQPITNEAPLGAGNAFRLTPEGAVFAKLVTITIKYGGDMQPGLSWIATQKTDGTWLGDRNTQTDENAKTLSVKTTHFSDWVTGKLIDFRLSPQSATVKVGGQVHLYVNGFKKYPDGIADGASAGDDDLAPLAPIYKKTAGDEELAPIPVLLSDVMERLNNYKLDFKEWRLSGAGSLKPSGSKATYTAPGKIPSPNPVTVSVDINATTSDGKTTKLILLSNIKIVDGVYVILRFNGAEYTYTGKQYLCAVPKDKTGFTLQGSQGTNSADGPDVFSIGLTDVVLETNGTKSYTATATSGAEAMFKSSMMALDGYYNIKYNTKKTSDGDCYSVDDMDLPITITLKRRESDGKVYYEGSFATKVYVQKDPVPCEPEELDFSGEFNIEALEF